MRACNGFPSQGARSIDTRSRWRSGRHEAAHLTGMQIMQLYTRAFARFPCLPIWMPSCPPPTPACPYPHPHVCACSPTCVPLTAVCHRYLGWQNLTGVAAIAAVGAPWRASAPSPPSYPPLRALRTQVPGAHIAPGCMSSQGQHTPGLLSQCRLPHGRHIDGRVARTHFLLP